MSGMVASDSTALNAAIDETVVLPDKKEVKVQGLSRAKAGEFFFQPTLYGKSGLSLPELII